MSLMEPLRQAPLVIPQLILSLCAVSMVTFNKLSERPKLLHQGTGCVAANGSKMNSLGVFELPMTIRGRSFLHPVTVVEDINDNIIGIDFIHAYNLRDARFGHIGQIQTL